MNFNACYLSCWSLSGDDSFYWCILPNIFHRAMCTGLLWTSVLDLGAPLPVARLLSRPGALASPCLQPPRAPVGSRPPPLSPAGGGGCAASQTSRTCSVSCGPLRTAASLAARTCHSARNGSGSSIPASGCGGDSHGHRRRYCSPVLNAFSLLFILHEQ